MSIVNVFIACIWLGPFPVVPLFVTAMQSMPSEYGQSYKINRFLLAKNISVLQLYCLSVRVFFVYIVWL